MISFLQGKPVFDQQHCTMVCGHVGYEVLVNEETRRALYGKPSAEMYVYTVVREDEIKLFGFKTVQEKNMFALLFEHVQGVGPRTALIIVNSSIADIIKAIEDGDTLFFTQFPRVGKKLAQKIILELRDKYADAIEFEFTDKTSAVQELIEALESLGYQQKEVRKALQCIKVEEISLEEGIKSALKYLHHASS